MLEHIDTQSIGTALATIATVIAAIRAQTKRLEAGQERIWTAIDEQKHILLEHDRRIMKIELRREILQEIENRDRKRTVKTT
jgi:GTP-sensing pleiotropic transcriptional regulator CodY